MRRCVEDLMARDHDESQLIDALTSMSRSAEILASGTEVDVAVRSERFINQMLLRNRPGDGAAFEPFVESPISGSRNPLSPLSIRIWRTGNTVRAEVEIGVAMEGAPGRAHGGITASLFDDVMGALQLLIGKSGYTRSLTIEYFAPFPIGEPVQMTAREVAADPGQFAVDADAHVGERLIARAKGIFTMIDKARFAQD